MGLGSLAGVRVSGANRTAKHRRNFLTGKLVRRRVNVILEFSSTKACTVKVRHMSQGFQFGSAEQF